MIFPDLLRSSIAAFMALAITACATQPIAEWRDPGYSGPVDNLLIVGVSDQITVRRSFEDRFVAALASKNVNATASYTLMPTGQAVSRATVEAAIAGRSIDAILVTRLLGVEEVDIYRPPPYFPYYSSYDLYYSRAMDLAGPGYYERYKVLKLETNLYDSASAQLIWSMQSQTFDSSTPDEVIREQIRLTIDTLVRQGLIVAAQ